MHEMRGLSESKSLAGVALIGAAIGGVAVGAFAIGALLGFSKPSAFHRAFKRCTGQAPLV